MGPFTNWGFVLSIWVPFVLSFDIFTKCNINKYKKECAVQWLFINHHCIEPHSGMATNIQSVVTHLVLERKQNNIPGCYLAKGSGC